MREAARVLLAGRRLDTGSLARHLGISRATLFGRVGSREALLGEALLLRGLASAKTRVSGG